jgi:PAS domain S-box-containing protein
MQPNHNMVAGITRPESDEVLRARLAAIVDFSNVAIISKTLAGSITCWNPAAERFFGYSAAETICQPMLMLFPVDRLDEESEILARLKRGERTDHFETVLHARARHVTVRLEPVGDFIQLSIKDDGIGFEPSSLVSGRSSIGLGSLQMCERAKSAGGTFKVTSACDADTEIKVRIPRTELSGTPRSCDQIKSRPSEN